MARPLCQIEVEARQIPAGESVAVGAGDPAGVEPRSLPPESPFASELAQPRPRRTRGERTRILGVDPGIRLTGYGCIEIGDGPARLVEAGVIRLTTTVRARSTIVAAGYASSGAGFDGRAGQSDPEVGGVRAGRGRMPASLTARLMELDDDFRALLARLAPACVAIETVFAHREHPGPSLVMAHARGVLLLAAARAGIVLSEHRPAEIKKSISASGMAGKAQIQRLIQAEFGLAAPPSPADVADALAIALCAARRHEFRAPLQGLARFATS